MKIHMLMQGKGGVGKSMIASILAQYIQSKGHQMLCIDTDPVNKTFHGYSSLEVMPFRVVKDEEIDPYLFDDLIDIVATSDKVVVIDNGSSIFMPLSHYFYSNDISELLADRGHALVIHTVIAGGQALLDTVSGFADLAALFPLTTTFVVWLNPFLGPIERGGIAFENMKTYTLLKDRISSIITIPSMKVETFGRDMREMLDRQQTFADAVALSSLTIVTRQRLCIIRKKIFDQLDNTFEI